MRRDRGITDRSMTLPPPPGRRVPCRNSNTGEGGGGRGTLEAGAGQGHWGSLQGGSGDSDGHGGTGDLGGYGGTGDSGSHGAIIFSGGLDRGTIVASSQVFPMATMFIQTRGI